jgi:hypothetical protein
VLGVFVRAVVVSKRRVAYWDTEVGDPGTPRSFADEYSHSRRRGVAARDQRDTMG